MTILDQLLDVEHQWKEQQDQQKEQNQPQQQIDLQKLIDSLDEHDRNPQLEKALRNLTVMPQMEDY